MCGISGLFNLNKQPVSIETLQRFTDSMFHRGPDGAGYELLNNGSLGMGHRRLSILDLSEAGHQPMATADKRYWIAFNGEVYNFNDLRNELIGKGYSFQSETDTEVILYSYAEWGEKCLDKFNGDWAISIWDNLQQSLFLARDRFGIKPLYYLVNNGTFAFASETRAFKFLDGYNRTINKENYDITLKNSYGLEGLGYTIFNDIYQVLPGHCLHINEQGNINQKRWYDITEKIHSDNRDFESQKETFYNLFRDACRIRLVSDVKVATALSGGLDSSSIYSTVFDILKTENIQRTDKESQLAVSAIFPGLPNDEKIYVDKALSYTGGEIEWIITDTENLISDIERETELFDAISTSPITGISAIYKGMKKAGITVSLDGHGVDEMLYGYLYMVYDLFLNALNEQNKLKAHLYADVLAGLYHPDVQEKKATQFKGMIATEITGIKTVKKIIKRFIKSSQDNKSYLPPQLKSLSNKPYNFATKSLEERVLLFEFFQNSLPALLRNFDRAGMMNGLEIRMPFMDHRLVEFIFTLPVEYKLNQSFTKYILREIMAGRMNEEIRNRKFKVGISSPFVYWAESELKSWLYTKSAELPEAEKVIATDKLNLYYSTKNEQLLIDVWHKINLKLIHDQAD
ncbi:MAG: asparagine synthase (glutamine-hydrolyzing) [Bacteroidota bacterium]